MRSSDFALSVALLASACTGSTGPAAHAAPAARPAAAAHAEPAAAAAKITRAALVGGRLLTAPGTPAIDDGVVVLEEGRILAAGTRATTPVPAGADVIDCAGATVTAGFWNSHVHLTEPAFEHASTRPAAELDIALDEMFLRWGFVHAVDTGSFPENTAALRKRIERGEVIGPTLLTMGGPFVAVGGQPVYVRFPLPELGTPEHARQAAAQVLDGGVEGIKLMIVSVVAHPPAPVMPLDVVRAVVEVAHARGAFVMAHPTNIDGVRVAVQGGVDVLAHTSPISGPWSADDIAAMRRAGVALTPTLKLWEYEIRDADARARFEADALTQVRDFRAAGGLLLFGTDVGYMRDHDPGREYELLAQAGLDASAILAMLTTTPAERWTRGRSHATIAPGEVADLVVLEGDPGRDIHAWTRVRYTIRAGRIVHCR
jgi:imidazolonepropionase-like amidohydrolase